MEPPRGLGADHHRGREAGRLDGHLDVEEAVRGVGGGHHRDILRAGGDGGVVGEWLERGADGAVVLLQPVLELGIRGEAASRPPSGRGDAEKSGDQRNMHLSRSLPLHVHCNQDLIGYSEISSV